MLSCCDNIYVRILEIKLMAIRLVIFTLKVSGSSTGIELSPTAEVSEGFTPAGGSPKSSKSSSLSENETEM